MMKEPLQRVSAVPSRAFARLGHMKLALAGGILALIGLLVAFSVRAPNLAHVQVGVLSGDPQKNYHTVVNDLAAEARLQKGRVDNIPSAGSAENIARLIAGRAACDVHFALVQEGLEWPAGSSLRLVGRLPRAESLVFLGRQADRIKTLADLHGMRIGIGPIGSGTEHVARQVLSPLAELNLLLSTHDVEEQLVKVGRGELDLGAMVVDEDAELLVTAVRDRGLQILNLPNAEALARRLPFKRVGRIVVGQFDPVRVLPREAKDVLQVDTLIVGNGCARRSVTQGFITVVLAGFPDFVRYNRDTPNRSGLPL